MSTVFPGIIKEVSSGIFEVVKDVLIIFLGNLLGDFKGVSRDFKKIF